MQEITAIVGRNASGKTTYIDNLRKQLANSRVRYISFRDSYGTIVDNAYYLQLRWNQHDIDRETPLVGEVLERSYQLTGEDTAERRQALHQLYDLFSIEPLLNKYVIALSSGELRKMQLTKTLIANPSLLIMDNPFIGLDAPTRGQLRQLIKRLAEERHIRIILVIAKTDDLPDYVSRIVDMDHDGEEMTLAEYRFQQTQPPLHVLTEQWRQALASLPGQTKSLPGSEVIKMNNVSIRYDNRTVLENLNWTVHSGEKWALEGKNGSGKSTLLSLVCADNPQSYACDISLFGRPRGSGESIWDIKRRIGYVSPEMHRSYQRDLPAVRVVASGLKDTVGLYARPNEQEYEQCRWWMEVFGVGDKADESFLRLSSGEQRLVLLARAFVKDPELLILDEPLHGLDLWNRQLVKDVIEVFCQRTEKTLIMVTHYQEELPSCITHHLKL